jgi:radical SAM protein (TIGR01212 family)
MILPEIKERYNSFNAYLRNKYGCKVYKLSLDMGLTCPNRDGTKGTGGCIFCHGGSGAFATSAVIDIDKQIELAKQRVIAKTKDNKFIAYFQAYTNTYAPIDFLRENFYKALNHNDIVALSIATRPDCLPNDIIELLKELNKIKPITIELGLQTIHEKTATLINRGYQLDEFDRAVHILKNAGIEVVAHIILGLPFETVDDILMTINHLNSLKINGIKL